MSRVLAIAIAIVLLTTAGCASTASFQGNADAWNVHIQPGGPFVLDEDTTVLFGDTTFGQYSFRVERAGGEVFYGRLPLQFQDNRVFWDILFPPLYAFNLRAVYPFYQFDPDAGVVRYRASEVDPWQEHVPTEIEVRRARSYFRELFAAP
jgi:hypothetical protein